MGKQYKGERYSLKEWGGAIKMDANDKLESYIDNHLMPPNMKNI